MQSAVDTKPVDSDEEKKVGVEHDGFGVGEHHDDGLPPDPDAGLSEEERAAIVSKNAPQAS
jgi:hypothetical protein